MTTASDASITARARGIAAPVLLLCPSVELMRNGNTLRLDRKCVDGLLSHARHWPGTLRVAMRVVDATPETLSSSVDLGALTDTLEITALAADELLSPKHLCDVDVVLASADDHRNRHVAAICRSRGIPCIYSIEYTLRTRLQFARQEASTNWRFLRMVAWLLLEERRLRRTLAQAASIQANGIPAFDLYARGKPGSKLYFDNRMTARNCISDGRLNARLSQLDAMKPLRLAFSGRLIRAKGADALIDVALSLRRLGTAFELHIFGRGNVEDAMRRRVNASALESQVKFHGQVDFEHELLPYIQEHTDIFVCCHRQGDPSCTYLETYGCGVPIAGYANEAHRSILRHRDVGWRVPMDDVGGLADLIHALSTDRSSIRQKSLAALDFARENLFEKIFKERMDHCRGFVIANMADTSVVCSAR